jgi:glycosyltransferase involved in cell wall biosynthesis
VAGLAQSGQEPAQRVPPRLANNVPDKKKVHKQELNPRRDAGKFLAVCLDNGAGLGYTGRVDQVFPSLLLLIPAYNEERRIGPVLRGYAEYVPSHYPGKFQLVVVLNGCRDNTLGVVQSVAAEFPVVSWVVYTDPIGKGGALIEGLKLAPRADLVGYVDADGATEPPAFLELVRRAKEADCVVGSRWLPGAVLHQMQSWQRRFLSRSFHAIVQLLFRMNIRDTQCSAKVLRREVVEKIHSSLCVADMAFDINLLYLVKRNGFTLLEVPTEWTDKTGSKVAFPRDPLTMLLSVIRVRWIYSPFKGLRPLFAPAEHWLYRKLRAPAPKPDPKP